jgi:hypothetical protein
MPAVSLRALLDQAIDYAGMFPPCSLALEPALQNHAAYLRSAQSWMLNGFVLPVEQFGAAKQLFGHFDRLHPLRVAALGPKLTDADAFLDGLHMAGTAIGSLSKYDTHLVSVSHLEMFLPERIDHASLKAAKSTIGELPVFLEAPPERAEETIALISGRPSGEKAATFGYKLRTGGVTADAFPTSAQIARALVAAAMHQVPIKFTAGLHHPIRQFRDEVKTKMHGFLNVMGAAVLAAEYEWDAEQAVMMLEDEDPRAFSLTDEFFAWRGWQIAVERLRYRRKSVTSFGSCSFNEPRDDLRALNLL